MSASLSHSASAEPNLTPMLDMVFQLVTFFMLVINFKGASMDLSLKLPVLGSARPMDKQVDESILILNIDHKGALKVYGTERDIPTYIATEAEAAYRAERAKNPDLSRDADLPTVVIIRADRDTPFYLLNRVVTICQDQGFRRFSWRVMNREGQ